MVSFTVNVMAQPVLIVAEKSKVLENVSTLAEQKRDTRTAERAQLGQAYNNYVQARGLENDPVAARADFNSIARDVLNGRDVNSFTNAEDQQLAQSLTQFKNSFEEMGTSQKNIAKDMARTVTKMQELQARQNNNNP